MLVMTVIRADAEKPADPAPVSQLTLEYVAPTKPGVVGAPADHVARVRVLVEALGRQLRLPKSIKIAYRECGEANAYYWRSTRTIEVCHELWDKRRALYLSTGHDRETIKNRLSNAMIFTVFHELNHGLHDVLKLPLLGSHEDAVDDLATLWMIRLGAGDSAKHAAYGHHLRGQQPSYDVDPWDEHSDAGQRGFAIACLLYGSDPQHFSRVFEQMNTPAPKIMRCKKHYAERLEAWGVLLGPHLTTKA
jgi:hypothetical protein